MTSINESYFLEKGLTPDSFLFVRVLTEVFQEPSVRRSMVLEVTRRHIVIRSRGTLLKGIIQLKGRAREYLTFVNFEGDTIATFHYTVLKRELMQFLFDFFNGRL